jgi:hypothetical protein
LMMKSSQLEFFVWTNAHKAFRGMEAFFLLKREWIRSYDDDRKPFRCSLMGPNGHLFLWGVRQTNKDHEMHQRTDDWKHQLVKLSRAQSGTEPEWTHWAIRWCRWLKQVHTQIKWPFTVFSLRLFASSTFRLRFWLIKLLQRNCQPSPFLLRFPIRGSHWTFDSFTDEESWEALKIIVLPFHGETDEGKVQIGGFDKWNASLCHFASNFQLYSLPVLPFFRFSVWRSTNPYC